MITCITCKAIQELQVQRCWQAGPRRAARWVRHPLPTCSMSLLPCWSTGRIQVHGRAPALSVRTCVHYLALSCLLQRGLDACLPIPCVLRRRLFCDAWFGAGQFTCAMRLGTGPTTGPSATAGTRIGARKVSSGSQQAKMRAVWPTRPCSLTSEKHAELWVTFRRSVAGPEPDVTQSPQEDAGSNVGRVGWPSFDNTRRRGTRPICENHATRRARTPALVPRNGLSRRGLIKLIKLNNIFHIECIVKHKDTGVQQMGVQQMVCRVHSVRVVM